MTALFGEQIRDAMERDNLPDRLIVTPMLDPEKQIGPGTVDLRLGTEFLEPDRQHGKISPLTADAELLNAGRHTARYVPLAERYLLHPGHFVLTSTLEFISMPPDMTGQVLSRSSWGRLGLLVATAVVVQPGFRGVLTLELVNTGSVPIELSAGLRIAQLQIWASETSTAAPYGTNGQYRAPLGPQSPLFAGDADELAKLRAISQRMRGMRDTAAP